MRKYFLTGLVILLPVALTITILNFLVNFFTAPFVDVVSAFLKTLQIAQHRFFSSEQTIRIMSKLLILVSLFFVIVGLGTITRWYLIRSLLNLWEKIMHKIPVVGTIYKSTKEIIKTFFTSQTTAFHQVVMVPFPSKGIYALGFIAGNASTLGSSSISVLVPTTPNPTSGFLLMYQKEDLIYLDMKPEEALKYILSCGLLPPTEKSPL